MKDKRMLVLNAMPVPTWNRLRVNDTSIRISDALVPLGLDARTGEGFRECRSIPQLDEVPSGIFKDGRTEIPEGSGRYYICTAKEQQDLTVRIGKPGEDRTGIADVGILFSEGSRASVLVDITGLEGASVLADIRVYLEKDASAEVVIAGFDNKGTDVACAVSAVCCEGSAVKVCHILKSNSNMIAGTGIQLKGKASSYIEDCAYRTDKDEKTDINLICTHTGKVTECKIDVLGSIADGGEKAFRGTIDFVRGSVGAKGNENEDVLLLGDDVVNKSVPVILCTEEDVEGNHGASIGQIDDEVLYYLRSRGLGEDQIYELLADTRLVSAANRIASEKIRKEIKEKLGEYAE